MAKDPDPKARNDEDVGPADLSTHPLVDKLNPDGDVPAGRVPLIGFIGPSKREGYIRVYRDLQFRSYYEVPRDAVHHTIPVDRDDPDSPTKVLVPANTPIDHVEVTTHSTEAGYVAGNIAQGRLGFTTPPGALPQQICTTAITCPSGCPAPCTGFTTFVTCNVTCPRDGCGAQAQPLMPTTCMNGECPTVPPPSCQDTGCPTAPQNAGQICTTAITCPSGCPVVCTGITTFVTCNVTCPQHGCGAQAQALMPFTCANTQCVTAGTTITQPTTTCTPANAQAVRAPLLQPLCITLYTHYPTWCPPICPTINTAVPTNCGPSPG